MDMKKTYKRPMVGFVAMKVQKMLTVSIVKGSNYSGGEIGSHDTDDDWEDDEY